MPTPAHSLERDINGRVYRIEVARAGLQWRARVLNQHGGPTALMPFYGATPDEAAQAVSRWLARVNRASSEAASR